MTTTTHGSIDAELGVPGGVIGTTPLVEIPFAREMAGGVRILAKLESVHPGGSLKDRPVRRMVRAAIAAGHIRPGDPDSPRLLDSSSGNAGIAYAMIGAALGVPVTIVMPSNASCERIDRIAAHGAELILTDPLEGYDFALREARRLAREHPNRYWHCDQYGNDENWRAHYEGTGAEIVDQVREITGGAPDAFVAGVGTGGCLTGVARRLREANPDVLVAAAIPDTFPGIEGLKPLGHPDDIVPAILDESLIDHRFAARIEDALSMCHRLARVGFFVGPSSGAYVHGALGLAASGALANAATQRPPVIVTILCDTGERYSSTGMWGEREPVRRA